MDAENNRRQLASQSPGLGAMVSLPQPYADAGQGSPPVRGEGYEVIPEIAAAVHKSYGPDRPAYADPAVSGLDYPHPAGRPALRHVSDIGDGRILIEPRADGSNDGVLLISPPAAPRRSLLGRALARLRRRA